MSKLANVFTHSCGANWTGQGRCHCSGCHYTFGGLTSFDLHRKGYKCTHPSKLGLHDNGKGVWVSNFDGFGND